VTPCGSKDCTNCHGNLLHLSPGQKIDVTGFLDPSHNRSARCHELKTAAFILFPAEDSDFFM
jgi:hypothetical protein